MKENGLDVATIHPQMGGKYSPNLYAWLTMPGKKHNAWMSRVYRDSEGVLWIGFMDDGFLIGARLMSVLCLGVKAQTAAWSDLGEMVEIDGFWRRYTAIGRCAIDAGHTMFFIGDNGRWLVEGETRTCQWCGNHTQRQHKIMETVERSEWRTVECDAFSAQEAAV